MEKFPDVFDTTDAPVLDGVTVSSPIKTTTTVFSNGSPAFPILLSQDRWRPAIGRESSQSPSRASGSYSPSPSRGGEGPSRPRQKSISDAFRTIRTRKGSISQNAQEIAGALRAPVSPQLVILCIMWYMSSALTNTSSKSILNSFNKPATLTVVQFALVSLYCVLASGLASVFPVLRKRIVALRYPIRRPSRHVLSTTLPLAVFQIAGHLLSSKATAMIPVSQVHTIKGLSPLFTVFAYRLVYDIRYPMATYMSLVPLTCGVMLACSGKSAFGGHLLGTLYALFAAIIFVTQNIFSKKLFNEAAQAEKKSGPPAKLDKLDKLNLLCYSSGLAFIMTIPIWAWAEGFSILNDVYHFGSVRLADDPGALDHGDLLAEFFFNGTFHWGQNILAFVLLSMVSPVTYSVASLLKRVFVIVMALLWFRNPITYIQGFGIGLTFLGLYLYDRSNESNKADRKARAQLSVPLTPRDRQARAEPLLPLSVPSTVSTSTTTTLTSPSPYISAKKDSAGPGPERHFPMLDDKKSDGFGIGNSHAGGVMGWLPPGTHQDETWRLADRKAVGV